MGKQVSDLTAYSVYLSGPEIFFSEAVVSIVLLSVHHLLQSVTSFFFPPRFHLCSFLWRTRTISGQSGFINALRRGADVVLLAPMIPFGKESELCGFCRWTHIPVYGVTVVRVGALYRRGFHEPKPKLIRSEKVWIGFIRLSSITGPTVSKKTNWERVKIRSENQTFTVK